MAFELFDVGLIQKPSALTEVFVRLQHCFPIKRVRMAFDFAVPITSTLLLQPYVSLQFVIVIHYLLQPVTVFASKSIFVSPLNLLLIKEDQFRVFPAWLHDDGG